MNISVKADTRAHVHVREQKSQSIFRRKETIGTGLQQKHTHSRSLLSFKCRPLWLILRRGWKRFHMSILSSEGSIPRTGHLPILEKSTSNNWSEKPKSASVCQREPQQPGYVNIYANSVLVMDGAKHSHIVVLLPLWGLQLLTHTQTSPAGPPTLKP